MSSMVADTPRNPHLTARCHAVHHASNESLTAIRTSLGPWSPTACTHLQCNSADIQVNHDDKRSDPNALEVACTCSGQLACEDCLGLVPEDAGCLNHSNCTEPHGEFTCSSPPS